MRNMVLGIFIGIFITIYAGVMAVAWYEGLL